MDGELLTGKLLVATPQIEDGIFHRSVVLILDHTDDGAQGVVLNRPLEADVELGPAGVAGARDAAGHRVPRWACADGLGSGSGLGAR